MIDDDYLRLLQREIIFEFNPRWIYYLQDRDFSGVRNQKLLRSFRSFLEVVNREVTEEYLKRMAGFLSAAVAESYNNFPGVVVGLSWTDDLNASALLIGEHDYGVILNHMPFIILPALFRLTTDAFTSIGDNKGAFAEEADFHATIQCLSLFSCDSFEVLDPCSVDCVSRALSKLPSRSDLACATIAAEFILLHEFSHIGLGHFNANTSKFTRLRMSPQETSVDVVSYSHEHEFAADAAALEKLFSINEERSTRLRSSRDKEILMGCAHFSVTLLYVVLWVIETNRAKTNFHTHPPAMERMRFFHQNWPQYNNSLSELLVESIKRANFISVVQPK